MLPQIPAFDRQLEYLLTYLGSEPMQDNLRGLRQIDGIRR